MLDFIIGTLFVLIGLAIPLTLFVLSLVAFLRSRRIRVLERRVEQLEQRWRQQEAVSPFLLRATDEAPLPGVPAPEAAVPGAESAAEPATVISADLPQRPPIQWEYWIGQKAFGWAAVALAILGLSFFLKYSYENNWVGAAGRVTIGVLAGAGLMIAGRRYYGAGWRLFSQMFTSAGIVALYLATYSAFGFYQLLPALHAGAFLSVIVLLSAVCAVRYNSWLIALVAVIGGLSCPLLMQSEHDSYLALFSYLAALNLGVGIIWLVRRWPMLGTLTLLGTQLQYWAWHDDYYHPEKFRWALGFQVAIFVIYFLQDLLVQLHADVRYRVEATVRCLLNAALWFTAFYVLMEYDYREWLGVSAIAMAALYAAIAHATWQAGSRSAFALATFLATSAGFVAIAIPLEADARWIAFGWSVTAVYLWWFSYRVAIPALRLPAAALLSLGVGKLLIEDLWSHVPALRIPLLNVAALPSLGVIICLFTAAWFADRHRARQMPGERHLTLVMKLGAACLLWLLLTLDLYGFFADLDELEYGNPRTIRWLGQMSVSVLWTVYASVLLGVGFWLQRSTVRWMSIAVFLATIVKVVAVDMSELNEIYRILAFIILAASLAGAARLYQRTRQIRPLNGGEERTDDVG